MDGDYLEIKETKATVSSDHKGAVYFPVAFKIEHKPGTHNHLQVIAETYLQGKGVTIEDGVIVI